jgi:hypothetical protein
LGQNVHLLFYYVLWCYHFLMNKNKQYCITNIYMTQVICIWVHQLFDPRFNHLSYSNDYFLSLICNINDIKVVDCIRIGSKLIFQLESNKKTSCQDMKSKQTTICNHFDSEFEFLMKYNRLVFNYFKWSIVD